MRRRYVTAILAREVLRDVARVLAAQGIRVMPLKGVLFQLVLYSDPAERALSDVDILVPERDFQRAIRALLDAGFVPRNPRRSLIECALQAPRGFVVDLHRRLFSPARYKLSTDSVFARASRDDHLLGAPLCIAHPHDTAAHLIGKFVSDHVVDERLTRLKEILLWVQHRGIEPIRLAAHLHSNGLGRAARYALCCGAELLGDPFFRAALCALPRDPVGWACARVARTLIPRWEGTPLAAAPAHLLNASLPRAGASAFWVGLNRSRRALLARSPARQAMAHQVRVVE